MEQNFFTQFQEVIERTSDPDQKFQLRQIYRCMAVLIPLFTRGFKDEGTRRILLAQVDKQYEAAVEKAKSIGISELPPTDAATDTTLAEMRLMLEEIKEGADFRDSRFFEEADSLLEICDKIHGELGEFISRPENRSEGNAP